MVSPNTRVISTALMENRSRLLQVDVQGADQINRLDRRINCLCDSHAEQCDVFKSVKISHESQISHIRSLHAEILSLLKNEQEHTCRSFIDGVHPEHAETRQIITKIQVSQVPLKPWPYL